MSRYVKCALIVVCVLATGCCSEVPGLPGAGAVLSGRITSPGSAKLKQTSLGSTADEGYMVVAANNELGTIYRATTDAAGEFQLGIPTEEQGSTFVVTIVGPDGKAVGPMVFAQGVDTATTGLRMDGTLSLGTVNLPEDGGTAPLLPGSDANVGGNVDENVVARTNAGGAPVGVASYGKSAAARTGSTAGGADTDQDGLINMLDADDDGNGIIDDFEPGGLVSGGGPSDVRVNFFMNLKIQAENAQTYYTGSEAQRNAALGVDTIITFEALMEAGAARSITSMSVRETPGPTYLPVAQKLSNSGGSLSYASWSSSGYAFDAASDRVEAFVRPNAVMGAGDTFTADIGFNDGTTAQYSRMINYVFKNIPKLLQYGKTGVMSNFDVADASHNGTHGSPILFDGTVDLVLVFNPPKDETGAYVTGMDYSFQMFYQNAGGNQINNDIDGAATWPSPPAGFDTNGRFAFVVCKSDLTLAGDNTYTFSLPHEIFPTTVQLRAGGTTTVDTFKLDITAEAPTGNAAIMLTFKKQ